jgi:predicted transcriptional regulator
MPTALNEVKQRRRIRMLAEQLERDCLKLVAGLMLDVATITRREMEFDDYNETAIAVVVAWGEAQDQPLDISQVSNILNLPRTTVKRTLERLVARGVFSVTEDSGRKMHIRDHARFTEHFAPIVRRLVKDHARRIASVARRLSKLDGLASGTRNS